MEEAELKPLKKCNQNNALVNKARIILHTWRKSVIQLTRAIVAEVQVRRRQGLEALTSQPPLWPRVLVLMKK